MDIPQTRSAPSVPELEWSRRYASTPRSVGRARRDVAAVLQAWHCAADPSGDAVLIVSELTANAVRHGHVAGRDVQVRVAHTGCYLRIEVSDAGLLHPVRCAVDDASPGGRGLCIIAALSARWGTELRPYGIGKTVWTDVVLSALRAPLHPASDRLAESDPY